MKDQLVFLAAGLSALGCDPVKVDALTKYGALLLEKNQVMNLTAITDPFEVAALHMLDCAALSANLPQGVESLADVGTGAGFPGLVVAILRPELAVTLLDPLEKRLKFIQEVVDALGLSNVTLLHIRGEDAGRESELRERFDVTTARAVADLTVLGELCLPLTKPGGWFLPMKSVDSGGELETAKPFLDQLGGVVLDPLDYLIPGTAVTHRIWRVEKRRATPDQFPRKWARIKKK